MSYSEKQELLDLAKSIGLYVDQHEGAAQLVNFLDRQSYADLKHELVQVAHKIAALRGHEGRPVLTPVELANAFGCSPDLGVGAPT